MIKDKKTVIHITGTMNFGGAEVLMMNIVRKLHDQFNFIFLINAPKGERIKGDFDEEILSLGAKIVYCNSIRSVGLISYQKQLISILRELKPDVVHCHLNAKCGIISKCASKAGVKKIISHCHAKLKFKGNIVKSALSYAELFWQKRLIKKHPALKICGIHNGYFNEETEPQIVKKIQRAHPDILIVCMGFPKQEKFIYRYKSEFSNIKVITCLGDLEG